MDEDYDFSYISDDTITLKLERIRYIQSIDNLEYIPCYSYDIRRNIDNKYVGNISLIAGDVKKTHYLYKGNIGYEILKEHQNNYYATRACQLLDGLISFHRLKQLIITCSLENEYSKKTIENYGAKLLGIFKVPIDNTVYRDDKISEVYMYQKNIEKKLERGKVK